MGGLAVAFLTIAMKDKVGSTTDLSGEEVEASGLAMGGVEMVMRRKLTVGFPWMGVKTETGSSGRPPP